MPRGARPAKNDPGGGCGRPKCASCTDTVMRPASIYQAQIDSLQKEATDLKKHVELLKFRVGAVDGHGLYQQVLEGAMLREFLRNQKYLVAGLKSAIAVDTSAHLLSPLSSTINLGSDLIARRQFLLAIKPQKLHDARQFLEKRTQFLDKTKRFADSNQFQSANGEFCASKLDVVPLYSAASVKQVYDVLLFHVLNVEISTAEVNGDVIVREEAETGDESVSQNRFVFLKKDFGVDVETNNVLFCEYTPRKENQSTYFPDFGAEQSDEGLITVDFVDEDELHPYRPRDRIRDDVTVAFLVRSYRLPASTFSEQTDHRVGDSDQREVVVLTRWVQAKFHSSAEHSLSDEALFDLRKDLDRVSDAILSLVRARFRSPLVRTAADASLIGSEDDQL